MTRGGSGDNLELDGVSAAHLCVLWVVIAINTARSFVEMTAGMVAGLQAL